MLRSCYSTYCRFSPYDVPLPLFWYFVPAGTPALPFAHSFGSINYSQDKVHEGPIGEIGGHVQEWYNGAGAYFEDPLCIQSGGVPRGTLLEWRYGCAPKRSLWISVGGIGLGGQGVPTWKELLGAAGGVSLDGSASVVYQGGTVYRSVGGVSLDGNPPGPAFKT